MDINGGFYFISTILDMQVELPVEITQFLKLERASESQISEIQKYLRNRHLYECKFIIEEETSNSSRWRFDQLPKEEWRYYVISYKGSNYIAHLLLSIADIIAPHLKSFLHYHTTEEFGGGEINGWGRDTLGEESFNQQILGDYSLRKFDQNCLLNLQNLFSVYNNLDKEKYEGITRALEFNINLQRLPKLTDLPVLGLFVIIEMLLTHKPNDKEIGDSLNHQIKSKIAFLSPRFKAPLDYSIFGNKILPDKIWGALYEYRSCIAHGSHIDFKSKKLSILRDDKTAFDFLKNATRVLLAHSIIEPDIINGLKPI